MSQTPVTPSAPKPSLSSEIAHAVRASRSGLLVAFPTETVYGVGAPANSEAGYAALLKLRAAANLAPFALHVPDLATAERFADLSHPAVHRFARKVFPGPITFEVPVSPEAQAIYAATHGLTKAVADRIYVDNIVRIRCPEDSITTEFLRAVDAPILASSASRPSGTVSLEAEDVRRQIGSDVEVILDGGRSRYGKPSTRVSVRFGPKGPEFKVERVGVIDERYIQKMLRLTVLMVCSGNTCRSPMAEGLMRKLLAQRIGIPMGEIDTAGYRVLSGGTYSAPAVPPTPEAVTVMKSMGIDITRHRSRPVTSEMVNESDVVFCMTRSHRAALLRMMPSAAEKIFLLTGDADIEDPIGGPEDQYRATAVTIEEALAKRIKELLP